MCPISTNLLKGNWVSAILPITSIDEIDYHRLSDQIDFLVNAGVDGIYTNGSTGEFYTQSEEEFDKINLIVAEKCAAYAVPFIIGANHMSAQTTLDRVKRSKHLQSLAYQVIFPEWFPLNFEEMVIFLREIAKASESAGIVLYNPPHASKQLAPEEFGMLKKEVPELLGMKVADGDEKWYEAVKKYCKELALFVPGHHLATGLSHGAAGSFSNVAFLSPSGAQKWYEMMRVDMPAALALESRIREFMQVFIEPFITVSGFTNTAVDKLLAAIGNWQDIGTRVRWPHRSIPESEADRLRPIANQMLPELFN